MITSEKSMSSLFAQSDSAYISDFSLSADGAEMIVSVSVAALPVSL